MDQTKSKKRTYTDSERLQRFKAMAQEVNADQDAESFDRAFASIDAKAKPKN